MKNYLAIIFFSFFTILSSCTETQKKPSTQQLINEIDAVIQQAAEQDDQTLFWKNMLNQDRYASDRVAKASINYHIGRSFAPLSIDSAEIYTTKALILIEDIEGFEKEKIFVYNGLGIIADSRGKIFLSSFYYNKVVSILDANPSISTISAKNKIQFYLHSAQSNAEVGLYENAFELNKKAESYIESFPENDYLRFRVYVQLFSSRYNAKKNTDSLFYYLEKIAKYSSSQESKRFYNAYKGTFLCFQRELDSARIYMHKALKMDQNELKNESTTPGNTYIVYTHLLENALKSGKKREAGSIISKLSEIEQDTIRFIFLKIC